MALFGDPVRDLVKRAERLDDPLQAGSLYTQAAELAEQLKKTKRAATLVHDAEKALGAVKGAGHVVATAHVRLARVAERLGLTAEAARAYEAAIGLDATLVDAIRGGRALAIAMSAWADAGRFFDREITITTGDEARAALMCEQAALARDRLGDLDGAVVTLQRAINTDPASVTARRELSATLVRRGEAQKDQDKAARDRYDAAGVLCDAADIVPDEERLALIEAALDVAPEHVGAIEKLEAAAPNDQERLIVRWAAHVEAFPDGPIADERRLQLGHALLARNRADEALPHFEALARKDDIDCALLVIDLHAKAGRGADAAAWAAAARARARGDTRLAVLQRVFSALRELDPMSAFLAARDILAEDPLDVTALEHCEAHCAQTGDWSALASVLSDVAERLSPRSERRLAILRRLVKVSEDELDDFAGALDAVRCIEAEGLAPAQAEAREDRMRLAERAKSWDELAELLEAAWTAASGAERVGALLRLAAVHRDHRNDSDAAARCFLRVLDTDAPFDEAEVLASLSAVLERAGSSSPMVNVATTHAAGAPSARRRAMFRILARLHDGWSAHERAFEAWSAVAELDAEDSEARGRLIELAVATKRHEHAVDLISRQAALAKGSVAVALHRRIARIAADQLDDQDRAADALTAALEATPHDRSVALELSATLERAGRHGERVVILRLLVTSAPDAETRLATHEELARLLATTLRDQEGALEVWAQIARGVRDVGVLERLVADARADDDAPRMELLLRRIVQTAPDAERRAAAVVERAEVLARKLGRAHEAVGELIEATDGDAREHLPALSFLETLAVELGDDAVLARALERQAEIVSESVRKTILFRLIELYEGPLAQPAEAVRVLEQWEEARPDDADPRLRIMPHLVKMRSWDAVLARLDRLFSIAPDRHGQFVETVLGMVDAEKPSEDEALASFYLGLTKRSASPEQRCGLLVRGAELFERVGAKATAFDAVASALAIKGPDETLLAVADRLARGANKDRELDAIYDRFTGKGVPHDLRRRLVLRHATRLAEDGRAGDALDRLLRATTLAPTDETLLDAIDGLAVRSSRAGHIMSAYYDRAAVLGPGEPAVGLIIRAVRAAYENDRGYDAVRLFARGLEVSAEDPKLHDMLESVANECGRAAQEQLMTVFEGAARAESAPERRAVLLARTARLMLKAAPDAKPAGLRLIEEALGLAPESERVFDVIEAVVADVGLTGRLDAHLAKTVDETMSDKVAATFLRRRARLLHQRLGKPSEAADAYLRLWALRPTDPNVFRSLRMCLLEAGRVQDLISAAERELSQAVDDSQKLALMRDVAQLWEEEAKNDWEAIDAWKRVLSRVPDDADAKAAIERLSARKKRHDVGA